MMWLTWLVGACTSATVGAFETCDLDVALPVEPVAPGDTVVVAGGPFVDFTQVGGDLRDIRVTVGGVEAEVVTVAATDDAGTDLAEDCEVCQVCRAEAGCAVCGACDGRFLDEETRATCFGDRVLANGLETEPFGACGRCEERLTFTVPEVPEGPQPLAIVNGFGTSAPATLTVAAPAAP